MNYTRIAKAFRYRVTFSDGLGVNLIASFQEITGFDATFDVIEYRDGTDALITPEKFSGLLKYSNITFTRGITRFEGNYALDFWTWMSKRGVGTNEAVDAFVGESETGIADATATIELMDEANSAAVATWQINAIWPVKYTGPDFKGNASELAIEKLEVAHRGFSRTL